MPQLEVDPSQVHSIEVDPSQVSAAPPDAIQKLVNYRTGNKLIDAPMGLVQGAAKGALSTATNVLDMADKGAGRPGPDPNYVSSITTPNGIGQGTGKFLEQAGEFVVPDTAAGKLLEGAPLLVRAGAKALTGAGVAAGQSELNPAATIAGGVLGGGAELGSAGIKAVRALGNTKAPSLANYSEAFAATPSQRPAIGGAISTLTRDGIHPLNSPPEMQAAIKGKLADLGQQYEALDPAIAQRTVSADTVIADLKNQQAEYTHGQDATTKEVPTGLVDAKGSPLTRTETSATPFVSNANKVYYNQLQNEIDDVTKIAAAKSGTLSFEDLKYLRDGANGRTNFTSPDAERNLYDGVGNAYRRGLDAIAPETTRLNRDYATYKQLESLADKNVSMGRGTVPSGLDTAAQKLGDIQTGAALGGAVGHATEIPGATWAGAALGAVAWPKLSGPAVQALKNAADNGALDGLAPVKLAVLRFAAKAGDSAGVIAVLGKGVGREIATKAVATKFVRPD